MSNINISAFQKVCRTCLSTSNLTWINNTTIIDVLQCLSDIKYSNTDELPQKLCTKCIKFMELIQSFVFQCQQVHLSLTKCLTDFKNNQNALLENETIYIVNIEDAIKQTEMINSTNNLATKELSGEMVAQESEDLILTNCQDTQNNTDMIVDNIEENISSNVEKDATDQHNLNLVKDEFNQTVLNDEKQTLNTYTIDECVIKSEFTGVKEEENVDLVTQHFETEQSLFNHQMAAKEEIKQEEIEIPNRSEINKSLDAISKKHEDNLEETRPHQCNVCNNIYLTKRILEQHKKIHINNSRFKCNVSKNVFSHKSTLVAHKVIHIPERMFQCVFCKIPFMTVGSLNRHMRSHTVKCIYLCDICGKIFDSEHKLIEHKVIHTIRVLVKCNICSKRFDSKVINKHKLDIHSIG